MRRDPISSKLFPDGVTLEEIRRKMPYLNKCDQRKLQESVTKSTLRNQLNQREHATFDATLEAFTVYSKHCHKDIVKLIVSFSWGLFDGSWFTTGETVLNQLEGGILQGKFDEDVLEGKWVGNELVFHQYNMKQKPISVFGTLSDDHMTIKAVYFWHGVIRELTFHRSPRHYHLALQFATEGRLQDLQLLVQEEDFDINTQKPDAQNYTVLHSAVRTNQLEVFKWLLTQGCDMDLKTAYGKTAWDMVYNRTEFRQILSGRVKLEAPYKINILNDVWDSRFTMGNTELNMGALN